MASSSPHPDKRVNSVLVTAHAELHASLRTVFADKALVGWEVVEADSLERAHFVLQHERCDVWLVDDHLCRAAEGNGLVWLTARQPTPVLLLADPLPERITRAVDWGCEQWLARDLALQPALLRAALRQTVRWGELRQHLHRCDEELRDRRLRINRLIDMLWETVPGENRAAWLTQRHVMLRLQEEINRAERHGTPLTLVLGEVSGGTDPPGGVEAGTLASWAVDLVNQTKRRCDVVGQYGPNCFLLLVQTLADGAGLFCQRLRQVFQEKAPDVLGAAASFQVWFGLVAHTAGATATQLLSQLEQNLEQSRKPEQCKAGVATGMSRLRQ